MKRLLCIKVLVAAWLAVLAPCLRAQDGLAGALSRPNFAAPFQSTLAVADLDGDNKPDGAVLLDSRSLFPRGSVRIQLHFSRSPNTELVFQSNEQALTVTALDVNHDGETDLVVEQAFTHKALHVWINEGHGDFQEGRVEDFPSLAAGTGEQLQCRSNQPDSRALGFPSQRGFEFAIFPTPLAPPPPTNQRRTVARICLATARSHSLTSTRAPPLS